MSRKIIKLKRKENLFLFRIKTRQLFSLLKTFIQLNHINRTDVGQNLHGTLPAEPRVQCAVSCFCSLLQPSKHFLLTIQTTRHKHMGQNRMGQNHSEVRTFYRLK